MGRKESNQTKQTKNPRHTLFVILEKFDFASVYMYFFKYKQVMMTLRALGNTGHAEAIVPSLYRCIGNQDNTMDIKIAAVQAFRRLSCGADVSFSFDLI